MTADDRQGYRFAGLVDNYERALRHAFAPPLLAMLALSALLIAQTTYLFTVNTTVGHSNEVLLHLSQTEKLLVDMETGQRGYLLDGDPTFLAPYRSAERRAAHSLERLEDSVEGNALQRERVRKIRGFYERWLRNARAEMQLRDAAAAAGSGGASARALRNQFQSDGKTLMDDMRDVFDVMRAREEETRDERIDVAQRTGLLTLVSSAVVLPLVGVLLALVTRRQLRGLSRQYEGALEEEHDARERLAATLASIGDGVLVTDARGRVVLMNRVCETLSGWTLDEARGREHKEVFSIVHEATGLPTPSPVDEVLRTGSTLLLASHNAVLRRHRDGAAIAVEDSAAPIRDEDGAIDGVVLVFRDVTERRRTTNALAASEDRQRFLFDTSTLGILYQDAEYRIFEANAAAERVSGLTRAQMMGREPPDPGWHAIREDGTPLPREEFPTRIALRTGRTIRDFVMGFFHPKTGHYRWVAVTAQPQFREGEEKPHLVYGLMEDVTERREAQAALSQYAHEQARIAETLQRSLLLETPAFSVPGLEVVSKYEPALDESLLGGDFFDVFTLPGGQIALVVGDVTGKGLKAAARTAEVKFALRAFLHDTPDPAEALSRLNRFLVGMSSRNAAAAASAAAAATPAAAESGFAEGAPFVCLNLSLVDPRRGSVLCAAAGAEPALVFRRGADGPPEEVFAGGVVLGADSRATYTSASLWLGPGDLLAIVTDGITEARRGRSEFFGPEGLARSVREAVASRETLAEVSDAVLADARAFAGGTLRDDVCLLFARRASEE